MSGWLAGMLQTTYLRGVKDYDAGVKTCPIPDSSLFPEFRMAWEEGFKQAERVKNAHTSS